MLVVVVVVLLRRRSVLLAVVLQWRLLLRHELLNLHLLYRVLRWPLLRRPLLRRQLLVRLLAVRRILAVVRWVRIDRLLAVWHHRRRLSRLHLIPRHLRHRHFWRGRLRYGTVSR